ncbi:MAG TPA: ATP-binding protein [Planctomycetota bacterium]|nr:ATP-binding protein [Planctomycetota bacterium]
MPLTAKLVLGFLFALVLQVAQMLVSSYFTAKMQRASVQVANALSASMAVQAGLDAVKAIEARARTDAHSPEGMRPAVYRVYYEELLAQQENLTQSFDATAHLSFDLPRQKIDALAPLLRDLETAASSGDRDRRFEAVEFLDDAVRDVEQALMQSQLLVRSLATEGVQQARAVHDLPMRASLTITLAGVVLMAVFVAWFSRQLVLPIERAHAELEQRVSERTAELATTVRELQSQITERERAEAQTRELNERLIDTSRRAGKAEIANGVLHNVGNVLNSVNVAANILLEQLERSKVDGLQRAVSLMREHEQDLGSFLTESAQGKHLPTYLTHLATHLVQERDRFVEETRGLSSQIDHMKDIVSRQQAYGRVSAVTSRVRLGQIVDDALRMHEDSLRRHGIHVVRHVEHEVECEVDRSKVLQILVNLLSNAQQALRARFTEPATIGIRVAGTAPGTVRLTVTDNGIGIAAENLTRIFAHGFTTKADGHGYGLHHSANAASEMGGRLWAESDGPDRGATFVLELPERATAGTSA